jgi:hypothetical protein
MSEEQRDGIEAILKNYSVVSDREDDWLPGVIMRRKDLEILHNPLKLEQFLGRFLDEKPFGNVALEAISKKKINKDTIIRDTRISEDILEKVLTNTVLPNIIPIKRMISLLRLLQIPLERAVKSLKVSLNRFDVNQSLTPVSNLAMRRNRMVPFNVGRGERSKESLKRDLESYIRRLLREGM